MVEYTEDQLKEITDRAKYEAVEQAKEGILEEGRAKGFKDGNKDLMEALKTLQPQEQQPRQNHGGAGPSFSKGAAVCRKPDSYVEGDDIIKYIRSFENYRKIAEIPDQAVTRIFLTYLDASSQSKLADLSTDQKDNWKECKETIRNRLQPSQLPYQSRAKLHRAKQQSNESIDKFISRITDLGNNAFKNKEEAQMREQAVLDALMTGLRSSHITMLIFAKHGEDLDLTKAKAEARLLEAAYDVRRGDISDEEEGLVLAVSEGTRKDPEQAKPEGPIRRPEVTCFRCRKTGHYSNKCPTVECFRCHQFGHISRECEQKESNPAQRPTYTPRRSQGNFPGNNRRQGFGGNNNYTTANNSGNMPIRVENQQTDRQAVSFNSKQIGYQANRHNPRDQRPQGTPSWQQNLENSQQPQQQPNPLN